MWRHSYPNKKKLNAINSVIVLLIVSQYSNKKSKDKRVTEKIPISLSLLRSAVFSNNFRLSFSFIVGGVGRGNHLDQHAMLLLLYVWWVIFCSLFPRMEMQLSRSPMPQYSKYHQEPPPNIIKNRQTSFIFLEKTKFLGYFCITHSSDFFSLLTCSRNEFR